MINKTERWWYVGQRRSAGAVVDLIQLLTLRSSCAEVVAIQIALNSAHDLLVMVVVVLYFCGQWAGAGSYTECHETIAQS